MKERPILFSPPMVRALLAGRKTQTRRIVDPARHTTDPARCPYGNLGDRLWVKEGWRPRVVHSHGSGECDCGDISIAYLADKAEVFFPDDNGSVPDGWTMPKAAAKGTVTSLYMPRWASRITLEITDVRVQRVGDISEEDAKAEGMVFHDGRPSGHHGWRHDPGYGFVEGTPRGAFFALWRLINGDDSLKANPWVWAISFKVVK